MGLISRTNSPFRAMHPGPASVLAAALGTRWQKASKARLKRWKLIQEITEEPDASLETGE